MHPINARNMEHIKLPCSQVTLNLSHIVVRSTCLCGSRARYIGKFRSVLETPFDLRYPASSISAYNNSMLALL